MGNEAENPFHRAVYLTGPTASGKTAVGVALARRLDAEVVALDSMTLYRGMDIGTAKPTVAERGGVPHHLIDVLDPWESASVAEYRALGGGAVATIEARGKRVLFVGGTALYLKALLRGLFEGPGADPELRRALEDEAEELGDAALHARLAAVDPAHGRRGCIPNDRRRVVRALEVIAVTGPAAEPAPDRARPPGPGGVAGLRARTAARRAPRPDRPPGRCRCSTTGLVEEVRGAGNAAQAARPVAAQGVGYREVIDMLAGRTDLGRDDRADPGADPAVRQAAGDLVPGPGEVRPWPVPGDEPPNATAACLIDRIASIRPT